MIPPPPGLPGLNGEPLPDPQLPEIEVPHLPAEGLRGNRYFFKNGGRLQITPGGFKFDITNPFNLKNAAPHEWRFDYEGPF